jgi:hypothetical protein
MLVAIVQAPKNRGRLLSLQPMIARRGSRVVSGIHEADGPSRNEAPAHSDTHGGVRGDGGEQLDGALHTFRYGGEGRASGERGLDLNEYYL